MFKFFTCISCMGQAQFMALQSSKIYDQYLDSSQCRLLHGVCVHCIESVLRRRHECIFISWTQGN